MSEDQEINGGKGANPSVLTLPITISATAEDSEPKICDYRKSFVCRQR